MPNAPSIAHAKTLTPIFAALGDTTRLYLVTELAKGEARSIAQLAQGLEISHQGVSKHLKVLESSGLVRGTKVGRERHFECDPQVVNDARHFLDTVVRQWDDALLRLKAYVE